jgi:membrane-associated phospholipid phosphatase
MSISLFALFCKCLAHRPKMPSNWQTFSQFQGLRWVFSVSVALISFLIGQFGDPFCKGFHWDDESINMPFAEIETFPSWSLVPIVAIPVLLEALVIIFLPRKHFLFPLTPNITPRRQLLLEINSWALIQVQALMFQLMFVDTMKLYAGRLRPDFLARLRSAGISPATGVQYYCDLMSNTVIREGRLSFPSGHSSTSFAAMVPLVVFLVHHLRPWMHGCVIRLFGCVLPLYLSFIVTISRTRDNRHHFADVLAGAMIGVFASIGAFWINLKYSPADGYFDSRNPAELEEGMLQPPNMAVQPQPHTMSFGTAAATGQAC